MVALRRIIAALFTTWALMAGNMALGDANAIDDSGPTVGPTASNQDREPRGRSVFLDVGAHVGETLRVVLDRRYPFQRIVCFEPVRGCWVSLQRLADAHVEICEFGLGRATACLTIHGAGS